MNRILFVKFEKKTRRQECQRYLPSLVLATLCVVLAGFMAGCGAKANDKADPAATAPPAAVVEKDMDPNSFKVDNPERFALATAAEYQAAPELNVTGVVNPDVSRNVPVPSLASGRVTEIDARLGDEVKKGQLLFKVQSTDVAGAFSDYRKAVANEQLSKIQLDRATLLFSQGAIAKSLVEIAQTAEDNAKVDLETSTEHLHLLGSDPNHPSGIIDVFAPVSGVITDQQISNASGVQALSAPNPFTISDLSHVWIICDVYENDLSQVHLNEYADIHLNAYPNRVLKARISSIAPVLDPTIRTAKVRLEVENPALVVSGDQTNRLMRLNMFVTATFHGQQREVHTSVPATAILHLHDRDWVYTPLGAGKFRRLEVVAGVTLPDNQQEVVSGLKPGVQVVSSALVFQNTVEQ